MSAYTPPTETVSIFNTSNYITSSTALSQAQADARYLQLSGGTERGLVLFSSGISTPTISNGGALSVPVGSDTLVGRATTDALTNKTIVSPIITTQIISGYAPIAFTSTWEAYGDSITAGAGVAVNQTWAYLVNASLGKTLTNNGVSGYFTHDMCSKVYTARSSDNTAAIFIGTNDIRKQYEQYVTQSPDRVLDQSLSCVFSAALYCALPVANKVNVRTGTTLTGTWINTPVYPIGLGTTVANSTMSVTVSGRYIVIVSTGTNIVGALYGGEKFNLSITNFILDGAGTNGTYSASNLSTGYDMINGPVASWGQRSFIYDTGVVGSHLITLTYTGLPGNDKFFVDYIGSWTSGVGNNTLIVGVPSWNYRLDYLADTAALYSSDTRRLVFNAGLLNVCHLLRTSYNLPVYYVDTAGNTAGGLQSDSLHPNFSGHKLIASRVLSVISNGEYKYVAE